MWQLATVIERRAAGCRRRQPDAPRTACAFGRGSACAGIQRRDEILDILDRRKAVAASVLTTALELLERVVAMLARLAGA